MKTYRVIQWATGAIGAIVIRGCAERDDLDLVGVYVTSAAKHGRDAGEIAGIAPMGVAATTDVDAILALDADCVCYTPLHPSVDEVCRILASGKNVSTICGWLAPACLPPEDRARIEQACADGGSSLYGTGVHPGHLAETTVWDLARLSQRIDHVGFHEAADLSPHPSAEMLAFLGFGRRPGDDPELEIGTLMAEAVHALAAGLGVAIDEVRSGCDVAVTTREITIASGTVAAGLVGAKRWRWTGVVAGVPRIEYTMTYWITDALDPPWEPPGTKYAIEIAGDPGLRCRIDPIGGEGGAVGRVWAAMTMLNAIPEVCAAAPGLRTHLDLPMRVPPGVVGTWGRGGPSRPATNAYGHPA